MIFEVGLLLAMVIGVLEGIFVLWAMNGMFGQGSFIELLTDIFTERK
jgi:hypothetical protein